MFRSISLAFDTSSKMKVVLCLFACFTIAVAMPQQQEGAAFTNEAIAQAQKSNLIPAGAQIQDVRL